MGFYLTDWLEHRRACKRKQLERIQRINSLPPAYHERTTKADHQLLEQPIATLVEDVKNGTVAPVSILRAYGKVALRAHEKTNCLTEVMFTEAERLAMTSEINLDGPLAGIPVSLKDSIVVKGFDTSTGYSCNTGAEAEDDGIMVKLLKEAGCIPFAKTNLPITLLSFESTNDVWGRCKNPHNTKYSPGGSTGGEAALLAYGGSRIGVGSDVAGSVRAPAHYSGCYSLRCSTGRWPKVGFKTSMPGQEGVPSVFSPMARTLDDLTYFTRSFIGMKPWRLDYSVHPIEWRTDVESAITDSSRKLRIGVMRTDGVVDPAPACARALNETVKALQAEGHDTFDIPIADDTRQHSQQADARSAPPSPLHGLILASQLLNSDGCGTFMSFFRPGESNDAGALQLLRYARLPRWLKWLYAKYVRYIKRDPVWASLLEPGVFGPKSAFQNWRLVSQREAYRGAWHSWWQAQKTDDNTTGAGLDFILCPVNSIPAVPHDGMKTTVSACGYTFLWNLLDYTAGVLPVTKVDKTRDRFLLNPMVDSVRIQSGRYRTTNGIARACYELYDPEAMHGLPVGVQVVGQRLTEEAVLAYMQKVEDALDKFREEGKYEIMPIDVE